MGWTATKVGGIVNNSKYHEIVCNKREDVESLPTDSDVISWGSICYVIDDWSEWILDESYVWQIKGDCPTGRTIM